MAINVVWRLLCKFAWIHTQTFFVIFLSLSVWSKIKAVEECDFVRCAAHVQSFLQDLRRLNTPFVCRNLVTSPWCSEHCMHQYFPNIPPHSTANHSFTQFCNDNIANRDVNWTCIVEHSFQLLTCFSNVSTLTTNTVHEDMFTESCRKSFEFQDCPSKVLSDCGKNSVEVVEDILQFISNYFMLPSCKASELKKVLSLPVRYTLNNDYMEVAKYMDRYNNFVRVCFNTIFGKESDLNDFLCGDSRIIDCINYTLSSRDHSFPGLRRLLTKLFLLGGFECKPPGFENNPAASSNFQSSTEVYISPSYKEHSSGDHIFSGETEYFSDLFQTSTTPVSNGNDEYFPEVVTKSSFIDIVESITEKFDQEIPVKSYSDEKDLGSDSSVNKTSKRPISHSNVHHLETSGALGLHCDRTLIAVLFLFILL